MTDRSAPAASEIEDVWRLSPLQEGLLFHALYDEAGHDVYVVQQGFDLEGRLDGGRLRTAADALVRRHANLRAAFWHEDLDHPVQVVGRRVAAPLREVDLGDRDDGERRRLLDGLMAEERARRCD